MSSLTPSRRPAYACPVSARTAPKTPGLPVPVPPELAIDSRGTTALLVDFLRRETRKAGFSKVVLGVSGGVDSAVAAALARRALGAGNVLCAFLPYRTSSPASLRDARRVAARL